MKQMDAQTHVTADMLTRTSWLTAGAIAEMAEPRDGDDQNAGV